MQNLQAVPNVYTFRPPTEEELTRGKVAVLACGLCGDRLLPIELGDDLNRHTAQVLLHWTGNHGGN